MRRISFSSFSHTKFSVQCEFIPDSHKVLFLTLLLFCFKHKEGLGIIDLGVFHWRPIKDASGAVLLVSIRHVLDASSVAINVNQVRWLSMSKLYARSQSHEEDPVMADFMNGVGRVMATT